MNLHQFIGQACRAVGKAAWSSPLARSPFWASVLMRLGHLARRWLRLAPREGQVAIVHDNKMMFRADSEVYFSMTTGDYEPGVTRLFDRLIESGMVVVDVGAHIGYYTLLAAKKVGPTGKVYAFEPAPSNYALLVKNIALNGYQNIVPVPKAVSNTQGTITFFLHPDSVTHSLHRETLGRGKTAITVETTTLDHFFEEQGWPAVHLVKMDIEGAELAALEGMTKLIERNRVCLILEFVPQILRNAGVNPSELLEKLSGLGFTIQLITKDGLQPLSDKASQNRNLHAELFCEKLRT